MRFCIPAFLYITPHAPDITASQPDEIGRLSTIHTLSLERVKVLHHRVSLEFGVWSLEFCFQLVNCLARRVFFINPQIVIGPTPFGTGVIHEHLGATLSKSTSPTRRLPLLRVASSIRLMPTSITIAPSFTISAFR